MLPADTEAVRKTESKKKKQKKDIFFHKIIK